MKTAALRLQKAKSCSRVTRASGQIFFVVITVSVDEKEA